MENESLDSERTENEYTEECLKTNVLNKEPGSSFVLVDSKENPIYSSDFSKVHFEIDKSSKSKSSDKRCTRFSYPEMDLCNDDDVIFTFYTGSLKNRRKTYQMRTSPLY
jgi:hypothetical protein